MPPRFHFRLTHIILVLTLIFLFLHFATRLNAPIIPVINFCPLSTSTHHLPTIILQGNNKKDALNEPISRTHFYGSTNLLPFHSDALLFQQSSGLLGPLPPSDPFAPLLVEQGHSLCPIHKVDSSPSSPILPSHWKHSSILIGALSNANTALLNLPILALSLPPAFSSKGKLLKKGLGSPAILFSLMNTVHNVEEKTRLDAIEVMTKRFKLDIKIHEEELGINAQEYQKDERFFSLLRTLWAEATKREKDGKTRTEWFVIADEDTFFPDFDSIARILSSRDSSDDFFIGSLSESPSQVAERGEIAFLGAGIFISRGLMEKITGPSWAVCLMKFGKTFSGDAMISHCVAHILKMPISSVLTLEPTLHQLDLQGDTTGFFQSGFRFTSFHNWSPLSTSGPGTFTFFPGWIESGSQAAGGNRVAMKLIGGAMRYLGGDNWGRRYVFDSGRIVVSLGYSIVIEKLRLSDEDLSVSELTWSGSKISYPSRKAQEEGIEKRTYYLIKVHALSRGIVKLTHMNRDGEEVDLIWDGRSSR